MSDHRVIFGNVEDVLRGLPAGSVDCVFTSPPYFGLRDYGVPGQIGLEATPEEYVARLVGVFAEVRRVLADHGTLALNLGDSYARAGGWSDNSGLDGLRRGESGRAMSNIPINGSKSQVLVPGLKPKDLCGIPWRVAFALQADGWWLRNDCIWCLSGGTRVYARTQKGDMPMTIKDLVRLDPATVQLWNGEKWTQALGWSRHETRTDAVQLTLRSGERISATLDHVWPTVRGNVKTRDLRVGDVLRETTLPEPEKTSRPGLLPDEEVGWFVGMYIAEGSRNGDCIQIAGHIGEHERLERLARVAEAYDGSCARHEIGGKSAPVHLHGPVLDGIIRAYVNGHDAKTKHLSPRCWQRSNEFLRGVLMGYLEGDGHDDPDNDRWRLGFTRNYNLEADLRAVAARLGMRLRLKPAFATFDGRRFASFRGELRMTVGEHGNLKPNTEIVEIGGSKARNFWHIGVADEPHLFALASGVLTHNSKPNAMPESVTDRFSSRHEHVFLLAKRSRYWFDLDAIREEHTCSRARGTATRVGINNGGDTGLVGDASHPLGKNPGDVVTLATQPTPYAHFATFPVGLVLRFLPAMCPPRVCSRCGKPWEHRVKKTGNKAGICGGEHRETRRNGGLGPGRPRDYDAEAQIGMGRDLGYFPACACHGRDLSAEVSRALKAKDEEALAAIMAERDAIPDDTWRPGTVLDPFLGSGTVTEAARKLGVNSVGIELNRDYEAVMRERFGTLLSLEGRIVFEHHEEAGGGG